MKKARREKRKKEDASSNEKKRCMAGEENKKNLNYVNKDLQNIAVTSKFGGAYRFWGKCAGRFFRPAPAFGVWSCGFAPTPAHDVLYSL